MKVQVTRELFDDVKSQFKSLDTSLVDDNMKDVLDYFKTSPCLSNVVPRWSCEGHSEDAGDNTFYIIFCTVDDGDEFLLSVFDEICSRMAGLYGLGYLAQTRLSVVNLIHMDHDGIHKHLKLESTNNGDIVLTNEIKRVWLEVLSDLTWEYYES